jgi:hypothetical protein
MMGSRTNSHDGAYEVFTRRWGKKSSSYRPGVVKFVKRLFWKRERKAAQRQMKVAAED